MPLKESTWMMPPPGKPMSWKWRTSSRCVVSIVGIMSKLWLEWMNKATVYNKETLLHLVENRPKNKGLLTVANHTSCIDDPLMWGALKVRHLTNRELMRNTSGAEDVCFRRQIWTFLGALGRVFPVVRGDGVYQRGIDYMIDQLNLGYWCHHFPEGKVNMTHEYLRLKWGVGRVIADCKTTPIVLPIWHVGMETVLPNTRPYIPRIRKHVTLLIGQPMDFTAELERLKSMKKSPKEIRKHITDIIQEEFRVMRGKAEALHKDLIQSS